MSAPIRVLLVDDHKMFLDGVITQRGIHAPESGIIDPKIFIDYLAKEINNGVKLKPLITFSENNG